MPSLSVGIAEVVISVNELPASGSVIAIVPCHCPVNILGKYLSCKVLEPKLIIKFAAPVVKNGKTLAE